MKRFPFFAVVTARQAMMALLILLLLATAGPAMAALPQAGGQTAPTPAPQSNPPQSARGVSPVIGVLVLLAPLVFLVWKSRGKKQPEIKGASCLPVIDESKRPFQILNDEEVMGRDAPPNQQKSPKS